MSEKVKELRVDMPACDTNVTLVFPGGEKVVVEARPSDATHNYNVSLNFILPRGKVVNELPGDYEEEVKFYYLQPNNEWEAFEPCIRAYRPDPELKLNSTQESDAWTNNWQLS